jgi:hypothetical protein
MSSSTVKNEVPGEAARSGHPESDASVANNVQSLWQGLCKLNHMHFRLAALEAQLAGNSLVFMMVAGAIIAALLLVAWLGFLAAAILTLSRFGIVTDNILLILLAVALNILLSVVLRVMILSRSNDLQFPVTIRSLQSMSSVPRNPEKT